MFLVLARLLALKAKQSVCHLAAAQKLNAAFARLQKI